MRFHLPFRNVAARLPEDQRAAGQLVDRNFDEVEQFLSGGVQHLLHDVTLTAAAPQVSLDIPATATGATLYWNARSDRSTDTLRTVGLRFNGASTANYNYAYMSSSGGGLSMTGQTGIIVGNISGAALNLPTWGRAEILGVRGGALLPSTVAVAGAFTNTTTLLALESGGSYTATTGGAYHAVRSVQVLSGTPTQFNAGSRFQLYVV